MKSMHLFEVLIWEYIEKHGTEIKDRKCLFGPPAFCSLKCPCAKINWIQGIDSKFLVKVYCAKFEPPILLRTEVLDDGKR